MSQTQQILAQLKNGDPITGMDALKKYSCFRLAARVIDIEAMGYTVARRSIRVGNKRVTEYLYAKRRKNG